MSDTPRTDPAKLDNYMGPPIEHVPVGFARQLERENNQLRTELELAVKCVEALRLLYPKHAAVSAALTNYDRFKSRKGGEAE